MGKHSKIWKMKKWKQNMKNEIFYLSQLQVTCMWGIIFCICYNNNKIHFVLHELFCFAIVREINHQPHYVLCMCRSCYCACLSHMNMRILQYNRKMWKEVYLFTLVTCLHLLNGKQYDDQCFKEGMDLQLLFSPM